MNMANSFDDLFEYIFSHRFLQLPSFPHIVKQISSWTKLHHKKKVFLGFKCLIEFDYMGMSHFL
jgi:hypothetical protein